MRWGVVVVAGGRVDPDLAAAIGSDRKCLAVVEGRTCLDRVVRACEEAGVGPVAVVTGADVWDDSLPGVFVPEVGPQVGNARAGAEAHPEADSLLFLPADAPFLRPAGIVEFAKAVESRAAEEKWLAAGLCRADDFRAAFPECPKPSLRLRVGRYHSGAYFAASPAGFRSAMEVVATFSENRRSQAKMALSLGLGNMLKFALGRFGFDDGERLLKRVFGCRAYLIQDADPESIIDIDDATEFAQVLDAAKRYWRS